MSDWYRSDRDEARWRAERRADAARREGWRRDEGRTFEGHYGAEAYGAYGGRAYGPRADYAAPYYERAPYGRAGGDFAAEPEVVRRVADGDYDRERMFGGGWREGEHRGRGPKNYRRSDERIREDVNERLADDSWLDASEIEVAVAESEVTLNGTVTRRDDKRRAEDLAERVSGVRHVQNNLRVEPGPETARAPARWGAQATTTGAEAATVAGARPPGSVQ